MDVLYLNLEIYTLMYAGVLIQLIITIFQNITFHAIKTNKV